MKLQVADIGQLAWEKQQGLLPAIVQHAGNGAVLMLGYMDREALRASLEGGRVVFYSRSRQQLWVKGETSGHTLELVEVRPDCDADALLVTAWPAGPVCHLGTATCFGENAATVAEGLAFIADLESIIAERIAGNPEGSYTAKLFRSGIKRMAQKVGEEGLEVALAAAGEPDGQLLGEAADLLFHLLVLLRARGLGMQAVIAELRIRHASGLTEAP